MSSSSSLVYARPSWSIDHISCKHICTVLLLSWCCVSRVSAKNINLLVWARRSDVYKHVWKLWLIGIITRAAALFSTIYTFTFCCVLLLSRDMSSRKVITSARNLWHNSSAKQQTIHPVGIQKPESQNGRRSQLPACMRWSRLYIFLQQRKAFSQESIYKCACLVRLL